MNVLEEWLAQAAEAVGLEGDVGVRNRDLILDLARDVAHGVARPAAPLTTFLLGLAAGLAAGTGDADPAADVDAEVRRLASMLTAEAASWSAQHPTG